MDTWVCCLHYPIQLYGPARTCLVMFLQLQAATILGILGKNFQNAFFWSYVVLIFLLLFFQCLVLGIFFFSFFNSCSQYNIIKPDVLPKPNNFAFFFPLSHLRTKWRMLSQGDKQWNNSHLVPSKWILLRTFGKILSQCF